MLCLGLIAGGRVVVAESHEVAIVDPGSQVACRVLLTKLSVVMRRRDAEPRAIAAHGSCF